MSKPSVDLEGAVMSAAIFAEIITEWMATSIGFETADPPCLSKDECTRIYWAMNTIARMTREADEAYWKVSGVTDA